MLSFSICHRRVTRRCCNKALPASTSEELHCALLLTPHLMFACPPPRLFLSCSPGLLPTNRAPLRNTFRPPCVAHSISTRRRRLTRVPSQHSSTPSRSWCPNSFSEFVRRLVIVLDSLHRAQDCIVLSFSADNNNKIDFFLSNSEERNGVTSSGRARNLVCPLSQMRITQEVVDICTIHLCVK